MNDYVEIKETGGKGWLFFSLIPASLAGAGLMWLSFYTGIIDWQKVQRVEGRMDNRVGVNGQLQAPVDLVITKGDCVSVDRAYLDGDKATLYIGNHCHETITYYKYFIKAFAPDGTIIWSDWTNQGPNLGSDEKAEVSFNLKDDNRVSRIVVWSSR